jgi:hypothetical protein
MFAVEVHCSTLVRAFERGAPNFQKLGADVVSHLVLDENPIAGKFGRVPAGHHVDQ